MSEPPRVFVSGQNGSRVDPRESSCIGVPLGMLCRSARIMRVCVSCYSAAVVDYHAALSEVQPPQVGAKINKDGFLCCMKLYSLNELLAFTE